jgi:hypothetical protein
MDAAFGYHPVFTILKCVRRLTFKPRVIGALFSLAGYCSYRLKGGKPVIPGEALKYLRKVQLERASRAIRFKGCGKTLYSDYKVAQQEPRFPRDL